ncbi:MAG: phosphoribosyltransferase [Paludibacteraceae bacterium]|nr:phosphoribosyltransferase [Paludibacteraceae bacterium]
MKYKNIKSYDDFFIVDINEPLYIVEGININTNEKTVSLTDDHDKGVDFSLVNNPVYDKYKGYDVISIFKRSKLVDNTNTQRDGNPFIYALKGKKRWKFNITNEEIFKYIKRFLEICKKINNTYDTIVITPSSTNINERFMKVISNQVKAENVIKEFFVKIKKEEIIDDDLIDKEQITKDYPDNYNEVITQIYRSFRRMEGADFEAKHMDKEYLKYVKYIGINNDNNDVNIRPMIDGKDILILDDTISSGTTVSQCIEGIISNFTPKSITIVTLLSQLKEN